MNARDLAEAGSSTIPPREHGDVSLAELTTLRVGGPARRLVEALTAEQAIAAVAGADAAGEPVLVLGGGSNLVIADDGFPGTVVRIVTRGVSVAGAGDAGDGDAAVRLTVAAGEPWDELVAGLVADDLAGVETLSGIPGQTGATPIQNVGAYGQQVSDTIVAVRAYDRQAGEVVELTGAQCGFTYRSSIFRHSDRHLLLEVTYGLDRSAAACPIRYPELARALGVGPGERPPLAEVREAVLELRRGKGMLIDPDDPDSVSAGSFFTNPILSAERFGELERRAVQRLGDGEPPPGWPEADGRVKTSAAWLIERAGVHRGYGEGRAGISNKHTLALVNRGGATTAELLGLAREVRERVRSAFGVTLAPEPTLIGVEL
jgi:UDP-N-acetylmuramate dehydrogenase